MKSREVELETRNESMEKQHKEMSKALIELRMWAKYDEIAHIDFTKRLKK